MSVKLYTCGRWNLPQAAMEAGQEARWPDSCNTLNFSYLFDGMNLSQEQIRRAIRRALEGWANVAKINFRILKSFTRDAHIWATDGPLPGGTIAWSGLATGSCASRIEQRYDTLPTWNEDLLVQVAGHEVGHALGMQHDSNSNALLYYQVGRALLPHASDVAQLKRLGYDTSSKGIVIDELDPTSPPPPPPDDELSLVFRGHFTAQVNGKTVGDYILVPRPRV